MHMDGSWKISIWYPLQSFFKMLSICICKFMTNHWYKGAKTTLNFAKDNNQNLEKYQSL